jgi:hypothetical protein
MRLSTQRYPADSVAQPETGSSGKVMSASQTRIVRSNMFARDVPEAGFDLAEIERQARAAQSAWIASNLKSYWAALVRKLRAKSNFTAAATVLKGVEKKAA